MAVTLVLLLFCSYEFCSDGIYQDDLRGYTVHSILAVMMTILVICVSLIPQIEWKVLKPLRFVAKYQYGIYLWHMPIIRNFYSDSPLFHNLIAHGFIGFFVGILLVSVVVGYYSSIWIKVAKKK